MKKSKPELLVNLDDKLERVAAHWTAVDDALGPEYPLMLLSGVRREAFDGLAERLPGLRNAVGAAELKAKRARSAYEKRKKDLHGWLREINRWLRASYRGTEFFALVQRVPGRGQSYQHWWEAAVNAQSLWEGIVQEPPESISDAWEWPTELSGGRTVEQFVVMEQIFEAAFWALARVESKLKLAQAALRRAQREATDLLMAYGHGVQARLGQEGELVRSIPQLWPKHKARMKPPAPPLRESRG